jgi:hypothetical protein
LVLLGSTASAGRIIKVPLDFDNIQAAIDDANDGDLIFVSDGIYRGQGNRDIDFLGKGIAVRSEHGPTNCIIDCQGSADEQHMGFLFHSGEGPNSVLDGFTITNGYHEEAGAILCTYVSIRDFRPSNPTITNCVITNNRGVVCGVDKVRFWLRAADYRLRDIRPHRCSLGVSSAVTQRRKVEAWPTMMAVK